MSKADRRPRPRRRNQIESLEERLAMTVDMIDGLLGGAVSHHGLQEEEPLQVSQHALLDQEPTIDHHGLLDEPPPLNQHVESAPDFWLDPVSEAVDYVEGALGEVEQSLSSAHGVTGLNGVRANYGFTGGGQTVAVIDSGIAYDHYALGGGFGSNYRVVGGWDFTGENDADPYDDGPEGSHGTHVAGIIGSSHATHQGVAPDVDLVGLRVFDDNGAGYFSWVENALRWVHQNRNAFENPITAVNLSLGTNWNSSSIPSWAMLEDEFAQLEADGIFISVSAGNSFTSYNEPGLSYPAASPYVAPVMSMDDSGVLSYFSQRHQRAIAAPGRYIYSTIPDYAGNNNGITDDWANFSGTSMAAPYVAGASVIVREAMEFVGYTNITQDTIYDHMMATADDLVDSATGLTYSRLNLGAAIDALMPTDDYGSSEQDAYDLGTINALASQSLMDMNGVISTLSDGDYFTFTAGSTGTVTFTASNGTHQFAASWQGMGGAGSTNAGGDSYTMNVVAGQQYTVALSSSGGLGYYDLSVSAESSFTYTDWGAVVGQQARSGLSIGGETWFRVVAGQDGYLSAVASYGAGSLDIGLYDSGMNLLTSATGQRFDHIAGSGEEFYLRVDGSSADVDIRLTNLVSVAGSTVTVDGTAGNDALAFTAGANDHTVSINGVSYTFAAPSYDTFQLNGAGGTDSVTITGSAGDDSATLRFGEATLAGVGYTATSSSVENAVVNGGGGSDVAYVYDTAQDDIYRAYSNRVEMSGSGYSNEAWGFGSTHAYASTGYDFATFNDSAGDDEFQAYSTYVYMEGDGYHNYAGGFDRNFAYASTGNDVAQLHDDTSDDRYDAWHDKVAMSSANFYNYAKGFDRTYAYADGGGKDIAYLNGTAGAEQYWAWQDKVVMSGSAFYNYAAGFESTSANSGGGADIARMYDTPQDDTYRAYSDRVVMSGSGYSNTAWGYASTYAYASTGYDFATFNDSAGDDEFQAYSTYVFMQGSGYYNYAGGFDRNFAYASSGNDVAQLHDDVSDDRYDAWHDKVAMSSANFYNYAKGFDRTYAYASSGGNDTVRMYDTNGNELYYAWHNKVVMSGSGFYNYAAGFDSTYATATGGNDTARLYAPNGDDEARAEAWGAYMQGSSYRHQVQGFDLVNVYDQGDGNDTAANEASDYVFQSIGDWDSV